jgi:hypothetical protein
VTALDALVIILSSRPERSSREASMRSKRALFAVASVVALVVVLAACGDNKEEAGGGISLSISSPSPGTSVRGNVVDLKVSVSGIEIIKANDDTSGKTGHYHVFIDRDPLPVGQSIPKEAGIVHSADSPIKITGLSVGEHRFIVVLGDGKHIRLGRVQARTTVTVEGPSVDAKAPTRASTGQPVTVEVAVQGVRLLKAADDPGTGGTGHLHLFIDREPTPPGQSIPTQEGIIHTAETKVEVPDLAAGDHTIWVVLGDKAHVPFDPPVMDKVVVTVG